MNFRANNQYCNLRENSNICRIYDTKQNYFWWENSNIFKELSIQKNGGKVKKFKSGSIQQ